MPLRTKSWRRHCTQLAVHTRDLHGKFSAGMPQETARNTAGVGIKLATIPRDGNLIAENKSRGSIRKNCEPTAGDQHTFREIVLAGGTNPGGTPHTAFCRLSWQFAVFSQCIRWQVLDLEFSSFDKILLHLTVCNFADLYIADSQRRWSIELAMPPYHG